MSNTFVNWTSPVAIAGRVAERRRPHNWGALDDARRLPPALRPGRSPEQKPRSGSGRFKGQPRVPNY